MRGRSKGVYLGIRPGKPVAAAGFRSQADRSAVRSKQWSAASIVRIAEGNDPTVGKRQPVTVS